MNNNLNSISFSPNSVFNGTFEELNQILESESIKNFQKVNELKNKKKETIEEQVLKIRKKFKGVENLYESYDPAKFEIKTRVDLLFYEHICQNLPEVNKMPELISSYYRTIKELYETVNIKPETHRMLPTSVLNESYSDQQKRFSKILSDHISNNYFKYTPEKRIEKYLSESEEYAKILVEKGLDANKSIQISVKSSLLEPLIESVAMPKYIRRHIKYLCEDVDYGKAFDQEHLRSLWETFQKKTTDLARVLAAGV